MDRRLSIRVFDRVNHRVEEMRTDGDIASSDLRHRLLRRVVLHDLFAFRLFWLRVVSDEDAVA